MATTVYINCALFNNVPISLDIVFFILIFVFILLICVFTCSAIVIAFH